MPLITYDGNTPTVGGDTDTWGAELNTALDQIKDDLDALALTPANRIKGNNTGSPADVIDLTVTQTTAMLNTFGADSGSGGVKGLVPATAAGDAKYPLMGDGTWKRGVGRLAGCVITTTSVNGSTPTIAGVLNVASISNVTVSAGTLASVTLTFTTALPDTNYAVHVNTNGTPDSATVDTSYATKTTTTVVIFWGVSGGSPTEVSVSIF